MKRKGLQFEHLENARQVHGFAVDPERRKIVAQMTMSKPHAILGEDAAETPGVEEPGGQLSFPIHNYPSKVSWALANQAGRAAAAPHLLAAAMSEHYGIKPLADSSLSEQGARMSRSAVRRGLLKPHPLNPEMEANIGETHFSESEVNTSLGLSYENASLGGFSQARYNEYNQRVSSLDKFSPEQMGRAAQRVFTKRPKPGQRKSYQQGALF